MAGWVSHPALGALALVACVGGTAAGQAPTAAGRTAAELQQIYQRFLDAIRLRDTTGYRDLVTDDYLFVAGDTGAVTRGRATRAALDAASTDRWEVFDVERCDLTVRTGVAVGPCWYRARGVSDGTQGDWRGVAMVTFIRDTDGRWRIAATRPTVLPTAK